MGSRTGKVKNINCKWCKICLKELDQTDIEYDKDNEHICFDCKSEQDYKAKNLFWCKNCNVPYKVDRPICPKCNEQLLEVSKDLRPVFSRERKILLACNLINEDQLVNANIWRSPKGPYYYVNGQMVKIPSAEKLREKVDEIRKSIKKDEARYDEWDEKISEFIREAAKANSPHLRILKDRARRFLQHLYDRYESHHWIVSFSGGKDSTVIAGLVKNELGLTQMSSVFNNTTLEHPQTLQYIENFAVQSDTLPGNYFYQEKPKSSFHQLVEKVGPPSRGVRWCCSIFKAVGINELVRTWGEHILTIYGIRNSESVQRSHYCPVTEQAKIGRQVTASPIISWLDFDIWLYIFENNLAFNDLYRYGYSRVGCWLCPMNSNWSDFLTEIYFPNKFYAWRKYLISYAKEVLGKPDPEEYVVSGNWKKRFGGAGRANSFKGLDTKPCGERDNTFQYNLQHPVTDTLYEYLKPFGELDFDKGKRALGECHIRIKKPKLKNLATEIIVQAIPGTNTVRVTFNNPWHLEIISAYVKWQLIKYDVCEKCCACELACPHGALTVIPKGANEEGAYTINEDICWRHDCVECVVHFDSNGCLIAKSLYSYGER